MPQPFFVAEIEVYQPISPVITYEYGWATTPIAALAQFADPPQASATILASDVGYRTLPADGTVTPYPPHLSQAFSMDRKVNLDPGQSASAAAWGTIELSNVDGTYTRIAGAWNSDGRRVKILYGEKAFDATRGLFLDPSYASLVPAFVGFAIPWFLSDVSLSIPLRDATYWLERPYQQAQYGGTGGTIGIATDDLTLEAGGYLLLENSYRIELE
jgi:hypothetical protein